MLRAALIALQFLTRIPVRLSVEPQTVDLGRAVIFYPWVGLLIGLLLASSASLMSGYLPVQLAAILVLLLWVMSSGGLHLDGLADSADAWAGGGGDKQRILDIMQDVQAGSWAVIALVLLLLLKFVALSHLLQQEFFWLLVFIPVLARASIVLMLIFFKSARDSGLAQAVSKMIPRLAVSFSVGFSLIAAVVFVDWHMILIMAVAALAAVLILYVCLIKSMQGISGDVLGAAVELIEAFALLFCVFAQGWFD